MGFPKHCYYEGYIQNRMLLVTQRTTFRVKHVYNIPYLWYLCRERRDIWYWARVLDCVLFFRLKMCHLNRLTVWSTSASFMSSFFFFFTKLTKKIFQIQTFPPHHIRVTLYSLSDTSQLIINDQVSCSLAAVSSQRSFDSGCPAVCWIFVGFKSLNKSEIFSSTVRKIPPQMTRKSKQVMLNLTSQFLVSH